MKEIAEARLLAKKLMTWIEDNSSMHPENLRAGVLEGLGDIESMIENGILSFFNQSRLQHLNAKGENHSVTIQMQRKT